MATFRYFIEKRQPNTDGTFTIKASINHNSKTISWHTTIRVKVEEFDSVHQCIVKHPHARAYNDYLFRYRWAIEDIMRPLDLKMNIRRLTARQIKDIVFEQLYPNQSKVTFVEVFAEFIKSKKNKTSQSIYQNTLNKLMKYDKHINRLYFEDVDHKYLMNFLSWLDTKQNSKVTYFCTIRSVFNYAIDNGITSCYPFRKIKVKRQVTPKRSLSVDELRDLFAIKESPDQKYYDTFKLMFCLIGINSGDLCEMKKSHVVDGRMEYYRKKTGRFYSIKIEPEAMEIINKYPGIHLLLNFSERYKDGYRAFTNVTNHKLKTIKPGLSTYWARHTWATIAASLDIPKETIAHALGHGQSTVTDIYIDYDQNKVDEANRKVLDYVFNHKEPQ